MRKTVPFLLKVILGLVLLTGLFSFVAFRTLQTDSRSRSDKSDLESRSLKDVASEAEPLQLEGFDLQQLLDGLQSVESGDGDDEEEGGSNSKGQQAQLSVGERQKRLFAEIMRRLSERSNAYDGHDAEELRKKDPKGVRLATALTKALFRSELVDQDPTDEAECSCSVSFTYAIADMARVVADIWFHLDDEPQHQRALIGALRYLRPWSSPSACDEDNIRLCEMRRASFIEELIALDQESLVYRNMYAASLLFGLRRFDDAHRFLSRYTDRFSALPQATHRASQEKYAQFAGNVFRWVAPMKLFAEFSGQGGSKESDFPSGEAMCLQLREISRTYTYQQQVRNHPLILLDKDAATQTNRVEGDETTYVDPLLAIGLDYNDMELMTQVCHDHEELQSALLERLMSQ